MYMIVCCSFFVLASCHDLMFLLLISGNKEEEISRRGARPVTDSVLFIHAAQSERKATLCRMQQACDFLQTNQQTGSGLKASCTSVLFMGLFPEPASLRLRWSVAHASLSRQWFDPLRKADVHWVRACVSIWYCHSDCIKLHNLYV